jgi:hypothetical protein
MSNVKHVNKAAGMTATQARTAEAAIIALCLFALFAIFQPFSLTLFSTGCGLVVLGGLAFNLVPFCEPGRPARELWKAALVIAIVFLVVLVLALTSAWLYGLYLQAQRG